MGLILLNKEAGMTSNSACSKVKHKLGIKKAGHTGTLDPDVSGVLPIFTNNSTKLIPLFTDNENNFKEYECEMIFGISTSTSDISGEVIEEMNIEKVSESLEGINIENIMNEFIGEIMQTPPKYSAKKIDGKRAYELARKNIEFEIKQHKVKIFEIEKMSEIIFEEKWATLKFRVKCSKGTYIRTLCEDIGKIINVPATMKKLVRTKSDSFELSQCQVIDEIKELDPLEFLPYDRVEIIEEEYKKIINGNEVLLRDINYPVIYMHNNIPLAIYDLNSKKNMAKPIVMLK